MSIQDVAPLAGRLLVSLGSALVLTIVVELAAGAAVFRMRTPRELGALALVNVMTNPALNILLAFEMAATRSRSLLDPLTAAALAVLELAVVLAEWRLIAWLLPGRRDRALRISLVLNAASLAVGLLAFGVR